MSDHLITVLPEADLQEQWKGLFPNRSIPTDMRSCFNGNDAERTFETLRRVNQPKLVLSLLDALDHTVPLTTDQSIVDPEVKIKKHLI